MKQWLKRTEEEKIKKVKIKIKKVKKKFKQKN